MRQTSGRIIRFLAFMSCLAVGLHIYFTWCFYTIPEVSGMSEAQLDALHVMNYGVTLFFAGFAVLLFRCAADPLSEYSRLTLRIFFFILSGRLAVELAYPVHLPLSPVLPQHTSAVFKFLLSLSLCVPLFNAFYWKMKLKH